MKKQIFTLTFALCAAYGYSQNTFPSSGNVGIGTLSPTQNLDVVAEGALRFPSLRTFAFFGTRPFANSNNGLYLQHQSYANPNESVFRLLSVDNSSNEGFAEFNPRVTPNTTRGAISFGFQGTELMRVNRDGKVRIGNGANDIKTPAGYKLFVEEGILTEKVKVAVKSTANWADYVFAEDYKLMPLTEVDQFTKENKHLPNVPSAKQMVENGLDVAQMDAKLMEKVEELTLYLIEQHNINEKQAKEIEELKAMVKLLAAKNN